MNKFHINKHGVPALCRAKKGNCPLGGESNHFDNFEDAQKSAEASMEKQYGLLSNIGDGLGTMLKGKRIGGKISELSDNDLRQLNGRITTVTKNNGSEYRGYLIMEGNKYYVDTGYENPDLVYKEDIASLEAYERVPETKEKYNVGETIKIVHPADARMVNGAILVDKQVSYQDMKGTVVSYHEDVDRYEIEYVGLNSRAKRENGESILWKANQLSPQKKNASWYADEAIEKILE